MMPIQSLHISFSSRGGAGSVAFELARIQQANGIASELLARTDSDLRSEPLALPAQTVSAAADQFLLRSQSFPGQVSAIRQSTGLSLKPEVLEDKFVHLHWPTGVIRTLDLESLSVARRVIVHLHDQWPFTGVCHFSGKCDGFQSGCKNCPALRGLSRPLARDLLSTKDRAWQLLDPVFVSPSGHLIEKLKTSSVFRNYQTEVVPNPVKGAFFEVSGVAQTGSKVLVAVAANLDDPRKRIGPLVDAFFDLKRADDALQLHLIGKGGSKFLEVPGVRAHGALEDAGVASVVSGARALVSFSMDESAPLSISEAAVMGIPSVVLGGSSQEGFVKDHQIGLVIESEEQLSQAMERLGNLATSSAFDAFRAYLSDESIAQYYERLYKEIA